MPLCASINTPPLNMPETTCLTSARNPESEIPDLEQLIGLSLAGLGKQAFQIHNTNSRGEAIGTSYFYPRIGNLEIIVWYWNPESGFQIISSRSELLNAYGKDIFKTPFQFYKLMINESGTIAGSFLVDQPFDNNRNRKFNQYAWLWWSEKEGLHLSELPSECQIVKGLNDHGFVLMEQNTNYDFRLILKYTYNTKYLQVFDFSPLFEFPSTFKESLKKLFCEVNYFCGKITLDFTWYPFCTDRFDNDLKIIGHGACKARFLKPAHPVEWIIQIGYEVDNGKVMFYVKEIKNITNPHNAPNLSFPEKQYVIYEKEI